LAFKYSVYLAGPISGLDYEGATDWREYAASELRKSNIEALSPMRAKGYLKNVGALTSNGDEYKHLSALSTGRGITTRDRNDATRCDVLLVNMLGAKEKSIGTVMEIAWADLARIPIVLAMEDSGNVHEHSMILESVGFRVPSLAGALHIVRAILDTDAC
jgi:nucleoside 2-deoxyribosyltransferase